MGNSYKLIQPVVREGWRAFLWTPRVARFTEWRGEIAHNGCSRHPWPMRGSGPAQRVNSMPTGDRTGTLFMIKIKSTPHSSRKAFGRHETPPRGRPPVLRSEERRVGKE